MLQLRPVQQSPEVLQTASWGWQLGGCSQTPAVHTLEQHWVLEVQPVAPLGLHVGAVVPPSAVPPSVSLPGGGGSWHAEPSSEARHWVPAQHSVLAAQLVPTDLQVFAAAQRRTPSAPGTQALPPQHWSAKSHTLPAAMQQPALPV